MKKDIHPKYTDTTIILPDGTKLKTKSTMNADEYQVEVDFRKHRAWTGQNVSNVNERADAVAKFNKKFAGMTSFSTKKKEEK